MLLVSGADYMSKCYAKFLRICAKLGRVDSSKKDASCQFGNGFCLYLTRRDSYANACYSISKIYFFETETKVAEQSHKN